VDFGFDQKAGVKRAGVLKGSERGRCVGEVGWLAGRKRTRTEKKGGRGKVVGGQKAKEIVRSERLKRG